MPASEVRFRPALVTGASVVILFVYLHYADNTWPLYSSANEWLVLGLVGSAMLAPLLHLARRVARAVEGDNAFARFRRWAQARPRAARALYAAPTVLALLASFEERFIDALTRPYYRLGEVIAALVIVWVLPSLGLGLVARALLRGLFVAPIPAPKTVTPPAEKFSFSAVAVTPEASLAVAVLFAFTVVAAIVATQVPHTMLYTPASGVALVAYIGTVMALAFAFQRASRIAIGFDGVLVHGSSRTRFFAFHDVDTVDATRGGDVVLCRHGRVVLRLQLHGEDEGGHQAIAARIRESLARAREPKGGGAARLAEAVGTAPLARAAQGLGSFRAPGVTRDELWELIEAPSTAAASRAAAAQALAAGADTGDRTRMRIAAQHCAEPAARAIMERVGADEAEEEEEPAGGADMHRMRRVVPGSPAGR